MRLPATIYGMYVPIELRNIIIDYCKVYVGPCYLSWHPVAEYNEQGVYGWLPEMSIVLPGW